jgi:hypothetical protein
LVTFVQAAVVDVAVAPVVEDVALDVVDVVVPSVVVVVATAALDELLRAVEYGSG